MSRTLTYIGIIYVVYYKIHRFSDAYECNKPFPWATELLTPAIEFFSGKFGISVKGKGLTNVKMYVERIFFQKVKFDYNATKYQVSVVQQV